MILVCLIPTIVEAWLDRHGETKKGKKKDTIWLIVVTLLLCGIAFWIGQNVLYVVGWIIGWRILVFDPLVNFLLKRFSQTHKEKNINIWTYEGETAETDKILSKIPWWIRLIGKIVIFATIIYLTHG